MNKRIRKKVERNKNRARIKSIFKKLSLAGLTIERYVCGNGYFIFKMEEDANCHFKIKETPDWEYGVWLTDESFEIFGEHEELVDKFKPSATYISCENNLKEFINIVKKISKNPKLYFVDSLTFGDALVDFEELEGFSDNKFYKGYQVIRNYDENDRFISYSRDISITQEDFINKEYDQYYNKKKQKEEKDIADKKYVFNIFKELPNLFEGLAGVEIQDMNKHGWISNPRYEIYIVTDLKGDALDSLWERVRKHVNDKEYNGNLKWYSNHHFELSDTNYFYTSDRQEFDYRFLKCK